MDGMLGVHGWRLPKTAERSSLESCPDFANDETHHRACTLLTAHSYSNTSLLVRFRRFINTEASFIRSSAAPDEEQSTVSIKAPHARQEPLATAATFLQLAS